MRGYKFAVAWIALNDSCGDNDPVEILKGLISVLLVADLFGKDNEKVAQDVWNLRQKKSIDELAQIAGR